jgi:hypothetical protein
MAVISLSQVSEYLQKIIAPEIQNQIANQTALMSNIKQNAGVTKMDNDSFYVTLRTHRHSGIQWSAAGESTLQTNGQDQRSQSKVDAKFGYGTFRIDHKVMSVSDKGAIANILESEIAGLKDDLAKHINRQWFGYGNGQLCLANGAGSTTATLVVDTPGTRYLSPGMNIFIGSTQKVISTVDSEVQVTLTTTASWSDNDVVKLATADNTVSSEMMGLGGIVDDGTRVATLQNITRSSNFWWKTPANQLNTTATALTEAIMESIYTYAREYAINGRKPNLAWFLGPDMWKAYGRLLTATKKTATTKEVLNGGWKGLEFMDGVPVVCDFDVPTGEGYLVDLDALTWAQLAPLDFIPGTDGKGVLTRVPGTTLYEATAAVYGNLATFNVRSHGGFRAKT